MHTAGIDKDIAPMGKLKACPFCGSKADLRKVTPVSSDTCVRSLGYGGYFVMCQNCLTSENNYPTADKAIEAWNRRVSVD